MLLLMHYYEYLDISFWVSCLNEANSNFPILEYVTFSSPNMYLKTFVQLVTNKVKSNLSQYFCFNQVIRLWKFRPPTDLDLPLASIKHNLKQIFWEDFKLNFSSSKYTAHLVCYVHETSVNWFHFLHPSNSGYCWFLAVSLQHPHKNSIDFIIKLVHIFSLLCCKIAIIINIIIEEGTRKNHGRKTRQNH